MVLSLHKQPVVTAHFHFITAHFVRHCALKMPWQKTLNYRRLSFTTTFYVIMANKWWHWLLTPWRLLLPYWYSYKAFCASHTGLSRRH